MMPKVYCPICGNWLFNGYLIGSVKCRKCKTVLEGTFHLVPAVASAHEAVCSAGSDSP